VISPLLANIYLDPLDWLMVRNGLEMVRYADDMVVLCLDAEKAREALEAVQEWMGQAGLTLHPEKTRVVEMIEPRSHFDFLGYRFWRSRGGGIKRPARPKSKRKLRQNLKPETRRNSGRSMEAIAAKINPVLRGWYGCFKHTHAIHVARHFLKRERNYAGQAFWARGFFVDTVGRDTELIRRFIAEQEKEDRRLDQVEMPWIEEKTNTNKKN
jgi:hypothetical protein